MIGVFVFSETTFQGYEDRIHLFRNEEAAEKWQIERLKAEGFVTEHEDGYRLQGDESAYSASGVIEAFQDTLNPLEFFHAYPVEPASGRYLAQSA